MTPTRIEAHIAAAAAIQPSLDHHDAVADRAAQTVRPAGAFSRLDALAAWLAGWQRTESPAATQPSCLVFGADHGVAALGVSAYPADVTVAMAAAIENGVATSSALARAHGVDFRFVDVGVGRPTSDFTVGDAMTTDRFESAWFDGATAVGDAVARRQVDVLVLGEVGIGNTSAAAAVATAVLGGSASEWIGRGSGVDDAGLARKNQVVQAGVDRLGLSCPPLEVLRRVGGAELVAMAGAAAEARRRSIPLVLDGFIATASLLPLAVHTHGFLDHVVAGHCSSEAAHRRLLNALDLHPLLELDLRLGEASGALIALPLLRSAVAAVVDVATFAEASVPRAH